jgi:hypothetical protein
MQSILFVYNVIFYVMRLQERSREHISASSGGPRSKSSSQKEATESSDGIEEEDQPNVQSQEDVQGVEQETVHAEPQAEQDEDAAAAHDPQVIHRPLHDDVLLHYLTDAIEANTRSSSTIKSYQNIKEALQKMQRGDTISNRARRQIEDARNSFPGTLPNV